MGLGLVGPSVSLGLAMVQSHQVTLFFILFPPMWLLQ